MGASPVEVAPDLGQATLPFSVFLCSPKTAEQQGALPSSQLFLKLSLETRNQHKPHELPLQFVEIHDHGPCGHSEFKESLDEARIEDLAFFYPKGIQSLLYLQYETRI